MPSSGNARESRSFQYFYERTVPSLAGYCGSEFWNRLVLQVGQHEKSVWHALIALGSLHENFENDQQIPGLRFSRRGQDSFAVQEYNFAIRALLGRSNPAGVLPANLAVDVCLISCVLFACFEVLSGHYDSAIGHIRGGIKIMNEAYYDPRYATFCHPVLKPSTVTSLEMDNLRKMLIRLQDQAFTLTRDSIDQQLTNSTAYGDAHLEIPDVFRSVAEARDIFEYYRYKAARDETTLDGTESDTNAQLLRIYEPILTKFLTALSTFEQTRQTLLTPREQIALKILKIHQNMHLARLSYAKHGLNNQASWDRYNPIFSEIVDLAASVIDTTHGIDCLSLSPAQLENLSNQGLLKPSFTLDMGIIGPVFNATTLCRDPLIRRRAVQVLRSASRQEGCFNSHVCAVVAEHAIAIEEAAAAGAVSGSGSGSGSGSLLRILPELEKYKFASVTACSEVPDAARLSYVYPRVDAVRKRVYMRLGLRGVDVDVPLMKMTLMMDMAA
ncbi:uncharacterized protein APUU_40208S [Aspergillus puulaauensis]|uniref:Uncharacterized protein n=1 Tax=Aspergillus puulaauensis TaxID=1220207 RepID=A0A7R7XM27_9EURO|nr:uncharacterized protein APUU_40208S [Aspergillus puulaauensis]BCS23764.1 hypothetical protein APUU_40208S [Aspergillus puulaauensis]